jgi:hypothetical protein
VTAPVAIVIPWRPAADRQPILTWLIGELQDHYPQCQIVLGVLPDDVPWCKAKAVQSAISAVPGSVTIVVHDADVWTFGLTDAIRAVHYNNRPWAMPHTLVRRLKPRPTRYVLDGGWLPKEPVERKPYIGVEGGGITVVRRDVWDCCPLDAEFTGWGQEDESWGIALRRLYGPPWRGTDDLVHLWHEPQNRHTSVFGSPESRYRHLRYLLAAGQPGPEALLALLDKGRPDVHAEVQVQPFGGSASDQDVQGLGVTCPETSLSCSGEAPQVHRRQRLLDTAPRPRCGCRQVEVVAQPHPPDQAGA